MSRQYLVGLGVGLLVTAVALVTAVKAQAPEAKDKAKADTYKVSRTPWGDPDIQGIWNFGTITPLQRPLKGEFADRAGLTPEEIKAINDKEATRASVENRKNLDKTTDVELAYNQEWWDRGVSAGRTSLIVDPPDGRLPPYTKAGAERLALLEGGMGGNRRGFDSYASRALNERCLVYRPVPIRSSGYNNNNQIVQGPGYVAMLQEQIHETRIIPLDGRPFTGDSIRPWLGVSRGHWEGDTLVVETKNFHRDSNYEGSGPNRVVTERFTRMANDQMNYEFTVNDPTTWERPFTAQMPWRIDEGPLYEYACHEGNYGMVNMLRSERNLEKARGSKSNRR
ncbi:MAG: hypothetical protein ABL961_05610 [Vicinamibacterales bacterium]